MDGWIGKKTKQELYCPFFSLSPCLPILGSSNNDDDDDVIQRLFPHTHTTYIETYIFHSRFPYISIENTFNRIECERQKKKICFSFFALLVPYIIIIHRKRESRI